MAFLKTLKTQITRLSWPEYTKVTKSYYGLHEITVETQMKRLSWPVFTKLIKSYYGLLENTVETNYDTFTHIYALNIGIGS